MYFSVFLFVGGVVTWRLVGVDRSDALAAKNRTSGGSGGGSTAPSPPTGPWEPDPRNYIGIAKTTRYWDCCKPSCSWRSNVNNLAQSASPVTSCTKDGGVADENAKNICGGGGGNVSGPQDQIENISDC